MSRRQSESMADTIKYRLVEIEIEPKTEKPPEVVLVLNETTPSSKIKLRPTWLFKTIPTGSLAQDIGLRVYADRHGSEPFAWSASRLVIEDDAGLYLSKKPAKQKSCSTTLSKETSFGNGDEVEFRKDFTKHPNEVSKIGTCTFRIIIESSRHLPAELDHVSQNGARFGPSMDDTLDAWQAVCEDSSGRPTRQGVGSSALAAGNPNGIIHDSLFQGSQTSQDGTSEEFEDTDTQSHADYGDDVEEADPHRALSLTSPPQAPSGSLKRASDSHTQSTDDDCLRNNESVGVSTVPMGKRRRFFPGLKPRTSTVTENLVPESGRQVIEFCDAVMAVFETMKSAGGLKSELEDNLEKVRTSKQEVRERLARQSEHSCEELLDEIRTQIRTASLESDKNRQKALKDVATSKLVDTVKLLDASFDDCNKELSKLEMHEEALEKAIQERNDAIGSLDEQVASMECTQPKCPTVI